MVQQVQVNGVIHRFPDEATPEMIAEVLGVQPPDKEPSRAEKIASFILKAPIDRANNLAASILEPLSSKNASSPAGLTGEIMKSVLANQAKENPLLSLALPEMNIGRLGTAINAIPKLGKYLKPAVQQAIPQGGYAAVSQLDNSPEEMAQSAGIGAGITLPFSAASEIIKSGNPVVRKLGQLLLLSGGAAGGYELGKESQIPGAGVTGALLSGYLANKGLNPKRAAERKLLSDIEITPDVQKRLDAAKRLGLEYITPAEATLSPFEAAKQGKIGQTSEGSKLLYQRGNKRIESEENSINNLLDSIYNEKELSPKKQAAYESTMNKELPDEFIKKFSSDPVIEEAINQLHKDPIYRKSLGVEKKEKGKPVQPGKSYEYWDHVKRILGDMEEANSSPSGRKPFKKSVISDTRRNMVKEMDQLQPKYEEARNIAERQFTRKKLEDVFDKNEINGNNFYRALKSNKQFNEIMGKLRGFPEEQKKLMDMRNIFGDLISNDPSIRTAAAMKKTSMWNPRELVAGIENLLNEKFGTKHDVEAVKLMTDPNWAERIGKLKEPMKREQLIASILNNMGKAGGQYESNK